MATFGLGANLGEPLVQLGRAVRALGSAVVLDRVSSVYRTEPVGHREQPDFLNLVCRGRTELSPLDLLRAIHEIEHRLGRMRTFRNAPRPIDIDLLAYGDLVLRTPDLVLPHPGIPARGFVLYPLLEIAPEWRHPLSGMTPDELIRAAPSLERVERIGTLPGGG